MFIRQRTYWATLSWITHGAVVVGPSVIPPPRKPMRRMAEPASYLGPQYLTHDIDIIDNCAASYAATSCICQCKSATTKLGREESQLMVKIATKGNSSPVLTYLQTEARSPKRSLFNQPFAASSRQLHTMGSDICEEGGRQPTETQLCSTCVSP